MLPDQELQWLVSLFDDQDEEVRECVDRRVLSMGPDVIHGLDAVRRRLSSPREKAAVLARMRHYNTLFKLDDIESFARKGRESELSLFEGSWLICSMLDMKLSRMEYETQFYQCAAEYMSEASDDRTAVENARIFSHIFYHRLHFYACDTLVSDERHALLPEILRSRRGNPIALAFLYFAFAQEAGLPIRPVCFPGGFVPAYVENGKVLFYLNIYHNGEIFLEDKLREFVSRQGVEVDWTQVRLREVSVLIVIYLESLLYIYSSRGDERLASVIEKALDCFGDERFLAIDQEQED